MSSFQVIERIHDSPIYNECQTQSASWVWAWHCHGKGLIKTILTIPYVSFKLTSQLGKLFIKT